MMLEVKSLEASYGNLKILNGIDLDVKRGDLVAIIGPNGSGKSTTIKTISGLIKPDGGSVKFNGEDITGWDPHVIVKLGLAYVPQGRMVFETLSVEENLEMGGFILKDKETMRKHMEEVYKFFPELKEKRHQKATFLSGGQQQMLSIGRAMMLKPDLLMLDEPSLGLAPNLMQEIFRKLGELNKKGTTIVLVEQNAYMALDICNKAYVLENGKAALYGDPRTTKKERVKSLYFGE